jgi:hypothetical protein
VRACCDGLLKLPRDGRMRFDFVLLDGKHVRVVRYEIWGDVTTKPVSISVLSSHCKKIRATQIRYLWQEWTTGRCEEERHFLS